MAFMSQPKKKSIHENLKKVIPSNWKWSLAVRHHSTLVLTIRSASVDLIKTLAPMGYPNGDADRSSSSTDGGRYCSLNTHYIREQFREDEPAVADKFEEIVNAMNKGNHDNSDPMTDYFDVGWYIDIHIGQWDKGFKVA